MWYWDIPFESPQQVTELVDDVSPNNNVEICLNQTIQNSDIGKE